MKRFLVLLPAILMTTAFVQPSMALPVAKSTAEASAVEEVGYRKCRWHNGHRHCRWVEEPSVIIEFGGRNKHRHGHHRHNNHNNHGHDRGGDGRGDGGGGHDGKRHNH